MASTKYQTMGQTPSRFGMPASGSAFGMARGTTVCATGASIARDRRVTTLVKGAFPGTSAWRPPNC